MTEPSNRARWSNPLTVAIVAAALAGFSNAYIVYANNRAQLELETRRAESERILEMLRIGEPARMRENLRFLVQLGLVRNEDLVRSIQGWQANPNRAPVYVGTREDLIRRIRAAGYKDEAARQKGAPIEQPRPGR